MVLAALIGGVTAFLGFWIAYSNDLPVGPTDVVLLGVVYGVVWAGERLVRVLRSGTAPAAAHGTQGT
jgi:ABC-type Mn2+/Zn2+ transport system permease subunit